MSAIRMILRIVAYCLVGVVVFGWVNTGAWEHTLLSHDYASPRQASGQIIAEPIKGTTAYVNEHEAQEIHLMKALMICGFIGFVTLGILDRLLAKKK